MLEFEFGVEVERLKFEIELTFGFELELGCNFECVFDIGRNSMLKLKAFLKTDALAFISSTGLSGVLQNVF